MFIGHYGVSYAGKAVERSVPLWALFIAVQLLDVLWGCFVLLGLEKVRIVPGITASNPLDLYYMPYTHSLVAALSWSVLFGVAYNWWKRSSRGESTSRGGFIIAAAVFSHWVLDLIVHRPDLPLLGDQYKVGLGLWNMPVLALLLEVVLLAGGLILYLRALKPAKPIGFFVFSVALVAIQVLVFFGAPPTSAQSAAISALISYFLFAGIAGWLHVRTRRGVSTT